MRLAAVGRMATKPNRLLESTQEAVDPWDICAGA
jgi:hypothetical protein